MTLRNSSPLVSIITPTYNHERFIGACIESIIAQDYPEWEQIIVDDGSTDQTQAMIQSFHDPRIKYHRQENRGPFQLAETYNFALGVARGELIAILEGDDIWPPGKLTRQVHALQDSPAVLAYGQVSDLSANGAEQRRMSRTSRLRQGLPAAVLCNDPVGTATSYMLRAKSASLVMPSTAIIRRTALDRIGGFQFVAGLPLTDYPTFLELSLTGPFVYSPEVMGYRRHHVSSVTATHPEAVVDLEFRLVLDFMEKHKEQLRLAPSETAAITASWSECWFALAFSRGRTLLTQKRWREARASFRQGMCSSDRTVVTAALVGYAFSFLHQDVEALVSFAGRVDPRTENA